MPALQDFTIAKNEDGTLTISTAPPVAVGGWEVEFNLSKRFGSDTPYIRKSAASGYYAGQSGITVANPVQGVFNVRLNSVNTSGLEFGNYAYAFSRLNSGSRTVLSEGYMLLSPNMG